MEIIVNIRCACGARQRKNGTELLEGYLDKQIALHVVENYIHHPCDECRANGTKHIGLCIDDTFWSWGADPDGVPCFVTGESTHYFHGFKDLHGKEVWVDAVLGDKILQALSERKVMENDEPVRVRDGNIVIVVTDKRAYRTFFNPHLEPDYTPSAVDDDTHWLTILPPQWFDAEENDQGIISIAMVTESLTPFTSRRVVGYNGILKGDKVVHQGSEHTVVMVSRMGDFGLSQTGELPYTIRVSPAQVKRVS